MNNSPDLDDLEAGRQSVAASIAVKTAQLAERSRHTDHNGHYSPPSPPVPPPEPTPGQARAALLEREAQAAAAEAKAARAIADLDAGRAPSGSPDAGARQTAPSPPPLLAAIRDAEKAGDWARSMALKGEQSRRIAAAAQSGTKVDYRI